MKNFAICPLKSGSKGNAYLITNGTANILLDCGISAKALCEALSLFEISCPDISAAVITHEHSDHTKGIGAAARKYGFPVYATKGTWRAMWKQVAPIADKYIKIISSEDKFFIGDIEVAAFPLSHDAADPVGYSFSFGSKKISVATDTGYISDKIFSACSGSGIAVIEANHDENMLLMGKYPPVLKQRIKSDIGHLSNEAAGEFAAELIKGGTKTVILGHLSEENNYPDLALLTVKNIIEENGLKGENSAGIFAAKEDGGGEKFII